VTQAAEPLTQRAICRLGEATRHVHADPFARFVEVAPDAHRLSRRNAVASGGQDVLGDIQTGGREPLHGAKELRQRDPLREGRCPQGEPVGSGLLPGAFSRAERGDERMHQRQRRTGRVR